nr:hypothetical protein CFP56_32464 [Quercus suber]
MAMSTNAQKATDLFVRSVVEEYSARLSIDGGSRILTSSAQVAVSVANATESIRVPHGPMLTIADRGTRSEDPSIVPGGNTTLTPVDALPMDHFTHAFFGIDGEDPKIVLQGLKHMVYALRPKGVALVVALKQASGEQAADGSVTLGLEEKIQYQSRGRLENLEDVVYHAGFERGKIRGFERKVEVDGNQVEAEIVLAMKWDQLTA